MRWYLFEFFDDETADQHYLRREPIARFIDSADDFSQTAEMARKWFADKHPNRDINKHTFTTREVEGQGV